MDWVAGLLELCGKWIVGHKHRYGWLFSTGSSVCWIVYVLMSRQAYGLLVICIPAVFINLWNFHKWSRNGKDSATKV